MMRSVATIILHVFVACVHAKDYNLADQDHEDMFLNDFMDKFSKNLVHRIFTQAPQASPFHHAELDATTLGKPGHLSVSRQMSFAPSPLRRVAAPGSFGVTRADVFRSVCPMPRAAFIDSRHQTPLRMRTYASTTDTATSPATSATEASKPKKVRTSRILSGVQPTGSIHLGNYLGAIRQWVDFQDKVDIDEETGEVIPKENFFCVVDLHAITVPHDPGELKESTLKSAALYLAAGIDPSRSKIFVQSHVPAHSEMAWLLNCATPMGWVEKMIQFKEKARKQGESVPVGLFTYPILMAADILLYQADRVPVGEDQRQHLELARNIAERFNREYCKGNQYKKRCKAFGVPSRPAFTEPEAFIVKEGARVMSLQDGSSKMSKSDPNDASRINVLDPPDVIRDKVKRCKTDSLTGLEWDNPERPEATNLLNIYLAVQPGRTREDILEEVKDSNWGAFKQLLADAIVAHVEPIQKKYHEIRANETYLNSVLKEGADAANAVASRTLHASRCAMGFAPRPE